MKNLFFQCVVNYDKETNSWSTILSKLKEVPIITQQATEAFNTLSAIPSDAIKDWDAWATSLGYTDKSLIKFLKDTEYSEKTLANYQKYMQKAGSATAKFGATLKTVAANVGIMLAISAAIKVATWAWDKFNTTVGEAQSDLEDTEN